MKKILAIICLLASASIVLAQYRQNSVTTNAEAAMVAFIDSRVVSPTNGITAGAATNIAAYQAQIATNQLNIAMPARLNYPLTNGDTRNVNFSISTIGGIEFIANTFNSGSGDLGVSSETANDYINFIGIMRGNGSSLTNLHGTNIQALTISNGVIANGTISTNKMDATAYAAFIGGGSGSASNAVARISTNGVAVLDGVTNLNIITGTGMTITTTNGNQTVGVTFGAVQTPWASAINGAGYQLTNSGFIAATGQVSSLVGFQIGSGFGASTNSINSWDDITNYFAFAVNASGFNGNLTTSDDTLQEVAQKLDDLTISGQTNVTDTASYASQVNSNLTVKGSLTVYGASSYTDLTVTNFVIGTNWNASLATNLNASELRSGTVPGARLGTLGAVAGPMVTTNSGNAAISYNGNALTNLALANIVNAGSGVLTALGVNVGSAGAFVLAGGAGGNLITNGAIAGNQTVWLSTNGTPTLALPNGSIATTTNGQLYIRTNGAWSAFSGGGGGDALVANPLSQFAATTSAQFLGVISDETGNGGVVASNAPTINSATLIAPSLGTVASGNLASATNYAQTNLVSFPLTFASATNTLALNNGYSTLSIGTDVAITNLSGVISGQDKWGTLVISNSAASAITARMTVGTTVRAQGSATTNALVIGAAKVGYLTFQALVGTNYWTTSQQ